MLSASFEINRGIRQGGPLSPFLFIIAVELLAVAIRSCSEINGIKIHAKEFKMVQYADDLTEAMWIGSSRNNTESPLALKWRKTVKALGVHFSYNNEESLQKNIR